MRPRKVSDERRQYAAVTAFCVSNVVPRLRNTVKDGRIGYEYPATDDIVNITMSATNATTAPIGFWTIHEITSVMFSVLP